ncbi:MAG: ribosome silencing factor [Treponema sp.]|nr:ribosome silencing factor [Treponema sp.]
MEDMLSETEALGDLLREHKGIDVLVLDLRKMETWTDFFIIATATSGAHLDGLERHTREFCSSRGIEILRRSYRPRVSNRIRMPGGTQTGDDEWRIIDLGSTVIHLMSRQAREFYDLERLYSSP